MPGKSPSDGLDRHTFRSWPLLVGMATGFSALFGLAAVMVNLLFEEHAGLTGSVILVAGLAFVGFLAVGRLVRRDMGISPD